MYKLENFSLSELRILNKLIDTRINTVNSFTRHLLELMPEASDTRNELMRRNNDELPELREMNVRILTAIEMVKQRETIISN